MDCQHKIERKILTSRLHGVDRQNYAKKYKKSLGINENLKVIFADLMLAALQFEIQFLCIMLFMSVIGYLLCYIVQWSFSEKKSVLCRE